MKQVLRKGLKDIVVDEVPDPVAAPHHVLVTPFASLISSGTEVASIHSEGLVRALAEKPSHLRTVWEAMKSNGPSRTYAEVMAKLREYAVLGYSGAGLVAEKHPSVTDLEVGDRVAYGGEGTGHAETITTGRNLVARVPDNVPFEDACFTTVGSIAMNAVRIANLSIGDSVVVIGLGLIGQLVAQLARVQGAQVIAIDLRAERIATARELGADHALLADDEIDRRVASLTGGRGADCVIIAAASKSSVPCVQAAKMCRDRGRIVVVGAVEMSFPRDLMYIKEIQVYMSRAYGPGSYDPSYEKQGRDYPVSYVRWTEARNMEEFLRLLSSGRVNVRALVSHRFPLADAPSAYETILAPGSTSLAVVLEYPRAKTGEAPASFAPRRKLELSASRPSKVFNVALVGAGNLARWVHLPNLRQIPDVALRAVYSANGARGKNFASRFGAAYCCTEYEQILQDDAVDMVMILSRNQHHASQALAALEAGKHVFLEKPMAITEDECRALVQAVESTGRSLTVGFNRRFAPFYVDQKRELQRRRRPAVLNVRVNSPGLSGSYWAADPAIGGAVVGEACHFVDLMYWLLDSEPIRVSAVSLPTGASDPIGENNVVASFGFADGSIASLAYCTVGSKASGGERVEAFASGGAILVEDFKWSEVRTGSRSARRKWRPDKGYAPLLASFVDCVRRGVEPPVTVRDGARATIACLRLLESARTGMPLDIDLEGELSGRSVLSATPA